MRDISVDEKMDVDERIKCEWRRYGDKCK